MPTGTESGNRGVAFNKGEENSGRAVLCGAGKKWQGRLSKGYAIPGLPVGYGRIKLLQAERYCPCASE